MRLAQSCARPDRVLARCAGADGTDAWAAMETNGELTVEERERMLDFLDSVAASRDSAAEEDTLADAIK
jgi:hypothetical protein